VAEGCQAGWDCILYVVRRPGSVPDILGALPSADEREGLVYLMHEDASVLWRETSQILSRTLSLERFRTWVLPLTPIALENGILRLAAPNEFLRQGVKAHYFPLIREALTEAAGREMNISLEVDPSLQFHAEDPAETGGISPKLNPDFTFDTFVVGPCNRLAHASAVAVADSSGKLYNPLFIYGTAGVGKTHLLHAICHRTLARRQTRPVVYMPCRRFVSDYIAALESGGLEAFRDRLSEADILALDDIEVLATRPQTQEEFFHAFNLLHEADRQIVMTSSQAPQEIEMLEQRLVSRCNWGLVARIEQPVFETRAAIIRRKTSMRGMSLEEDVIQLLADLPCQSVRQLEAALTRLLAYASLSGRRPDANLAKEAIGQRDEFRERPTLDHILELVCRYFGVTSAEVLSERRSKSLVVPRYVSMHLARRLTKRSLADIGAYFGGRDHTTVMHALSRVAELSRGDPKLRKVVTDLESQLLSKAS